MEKKYQINIMEKLRILILDNKDLSSTLKNSWLNLNAYLLYIDKLYNKNDIYINDVQYEKPEKIKEYREIMNKELDGLIEKYNKMDLKDDKIKIEEIKKLLNEFLNSVSK